MKELTVTYYACVEGQFYTLADKKWIPVRPPWNLMQRKVTNLKPTKREGKTQKDKTARAKRNHQFKVRRTKNHGR